MYPLPDALISAVAYTARLPYLSKDQPSSFPQVPDATTSSPSERIPPTGTNTSSESSASSETSSLKTASGVFADTDVFIAKTTVCAKQSAKSRCLNFEVIFISVLY